MSIHIPARAGITTWFNGDIVTTKLTAGETGGALGLLEATCPPGGGPRPHVHQEHDETFYLLAGDLEFLQGDRVLTAGPGDVVFIRRGTTHRFYNPGIQPARMLFLFTPGGPEGMFTEGGDEPRPGVQVQPWGDERLDERMVALLVKYDVGLPQALAEPSAAGPWPRTSA